MVFEGGKRIKQHGMIINLLKKFKVVTANSLILYELLSTSLPNLIYCPNGVDTDFFIPKKNPMLFSRKKAVNFALNLRFSKEPKILNSTVYEFSDELTGNILTLDITSQNFFLKINYLNSSVFQEKTAIDKETAVFLAKKYFSSLGVWDEDLTQSKVSYFKFEGQNLVETKKQKQIQIVRVDFSRQEIDGIPIVPLNYDKSGIYIIFSGNSQEIKQVLEARFYNFPPNLNTSGTYPLISGKQAWENLKNGKAYIAKPLKEGEKAIIRKIYLAYLEMPNYQPYLQPIFVFEGDFQGLCQVFYPLGGCHAPF